MDCFASLAMTAMSAIFGAPHFLVAMPAWFKLTKTISTHLKLRFKNLRIRLQFQNGGLKES
jgi:hypothetical protein